MYKDKFSSESVNRQSSTATHIGKSFLMKPAVEANSFLCTEFNFDQTLECPRVIRLQDYLYGIEELTEEQLHKLIGNQPVFYLQERFAESEGGEWNGYEWNGLILYRFLDKQLARKVATENADKLGIVLAFDSPLDNKYYILIKTDAEKFDEKSRLHYCYKHKAQLEQYLPKAHWLDQDFFVRAFTADHYDVVNRDALFGKPEVIANNEERSCEPMSVGEALKSFFSHLFRRSA